MHAPVYAAAGSPRGGTLRSHHATHITAPLAKCGTPCRPAHQCAPCEWGGPRSGSIRGGSRRARARRPGARVQVAERLGHGAILHKGAAYFGTADATVASMGRRAPSPSNALPSRPFLVPNCNCCVLSQRGVYSAKRSTATVQRAKAAKFFRMFLALHQPPTRERCLVIER